VRPNGILRQQLGGRYQQRTDLGLAIDVWPMRLLRGYFPYGLWYIHERIGLRQVLAQMPYHSEAVTPNAWSKMRKCFQIAVSDLPGQPWFLEFFFGQEVVEVPKQSSLTLIISAGELMQANESLNLK